jgi:RHS repeat-associated protein
MREKIYSVLLFLVLLVPMRLCAQVGAYDVHAVGEVYKVNYQTAAPTLESIMPIPAAATYLWESSSMPLSGFAPATAGVDATAATYTFTNALQSTTYFRRKCTLGGVENYSKTIKIEVVSINNENFNYIREHRVLVAGQSQWKTIDQLAIGDKFQTTTYIDNMGRPLQKVSKGTATPDNATPTVWGDVVQFAVYDAYSRKPKSYLPYTTTTNAGKYKTTAVADQAQYYTTNYAETAPYSNVVYDNSPMNRVTKANAPGTSWAASAGIKGDYELNTLTDAVVQYRIGYAETDLPTYMGTYTLGELIKTTGLDENGKKVVEYINKSGQLILKKVQLDDVPADSYTGWICTYNVYDDFGQLRFQIQPEAIKWLAANGWSFASATGAKVADNLCFTYMYDAKGRNIYKKAPGAKPLYMIYDNRDLLAFTQDGNQRAKVPAQWTAYFYDNLFRPTQTALYNTTKTRADLTTLENGYSYAAYNSVGGWAAVVYPADFSDPAIMVPIKYNYYDNYNYANAKPFETLTDNALAGSIGGEPIAKTMRTLSMPTGSKVRILTTTRFLMNTIYYDERGRAIQTLEENVKFATDITTLQYDYNSRLLNTAEKHTAAGTAYIGYSRVTKYSFDKLGRVTGIYKKFGSNAFKQISNYAFDDMGRLKTKRLAPGYTGTGKTEIETLTYSYNIHNAITGINKDYALKKPGLTKWDNFFGQYLGYDNKDGLFANAQLDGHVTGVLWSTQGDDAQRKYDYSYDNAGRLVNANYNERQKTTEAFSNARMDFGVTGTVQGKINYDLNGNLLSMIQRGVVIGNASPVHIDELKYSYELLSNKLLSVTDGATTGLANGKQGDFADQPATSVLSSVDDYVYDDNGNLVIDLNKNAKDLNNVAGANGITYNFLDKPELINIKGKGLIRILYDADGNKLQRTYIPENTAIATSNISYINGFVYKDTKLQFISFEEGRLRILQNVNTNNSYDYLQIDGTETMLDSKKGTYDFFIRDYQSNVRMVLTEETHKGSNICTMETARAANEEPIFGKTDVNGVPTADNEVKARFAITGIPGQATGNGWTNTTIGSYVSKLQNKGTAIRVGPSSLLKVMAGDKVSATTIYYYQNPVNNNTPSATILSDILSSLTNAIGSSPVAGDLVKGAASNLTTNLGGDVPFVNITRPDASNTAGTNPKAYLTVLFFDERFNFVGEGSTTQRVQGAGNGQAPLVIADVKAPKNGYAYIYISNGSTEPVFFDNLRVVHERGRITEENHYYAYGLKIAGISSSKAGDVNEGELKNRRQYQGAFSEYDEDIQWNDFALRNYDPQIARWVQQDPYQQFASPYVALGGDPVNMVDPSGGWSATGIFAGTSLAGRCIITTVLGAIAGNIIGGQKNGGKGMLIGAFAGLASNFIGSGSWSIGAKVGLELGVQGAKVLANQAVDNAMQRNVGRQMFGGDGPGPKPRLIVITEVYYKGKALPLGTTTTYDGNASKGVQKIKVGTETVDEGEDKGDIVTIKRSYDGPTAYGGYNMVERVVDIKPKANIIPPKFATPISPDNPSKIDNPKTTSEDGIDFFIPDSDSGKKDPRCFRTPRTFKKPKP